MLPMSVFLIVKIIGTKKYVVIMYNVCMYAYKYTYIYIAWLK